MPINWLKRNQNLYLPQFSQPPGVVSPRIVPRENKLIHPQVMMSELAFRKQRIYVQEAKEEVSWMGLVKRFDEETFFIEDVFLVKQECSMTTTDMLVEGHEELFQELCELYPEEGSGVVNRLRYWGHSHVYMGTAPSLTDLKQLQSFMDVKPEFYLSGILNKQGHFNFMLDILEPAIRYEGLPFGIDLDPKSDSSLREDIKAEMSRKVKSITGTQKSKSLSPLATGKGALPTPIAPSEHPKLFDLGER